MILFSRFSSWLSLAVDSVGFGCNFDFSSLFVTSLVGWVSTAKKLTRICL